MARALTSGLTLVLRTSFRYYFAENFMVSLDWTLATLYNLSGKDGREDFDLGRFSMRENSEAPSAYPLFILKNFRRPRAFF